MGGDGGRQQETLGMLGEKGKYTRESQSKHEAKKPKLEQKGKKLFQE